MASKLTNEPLAKARALSAAARSSRSLSYKRLGKLIPQKTQQSMPISSATQTHTQICTHTHIRTKEMNKRAHTHPHTQTHTHTHTTHPHPNPPTLPPTHPHFWIQLKCLHMFHAAKGQNSSLKLGFAEGQHLLQFLSRVLRWNLHGTGSTANRGPGDPALICHLLDQAFQHSL